MNEFTQLAETLHSLFTACVIADFTESQAMTITTNVAREIVAHGFPAEGLKLWLKLLCAEISIMKYEFRWTPTNFTNSNGH